MLPRVVYYRQSALTRMTPLATCARMGDAAGVASLLMQGTKLQVFESL